MAWSWILNLNIYNPFYAVLLGVFWGIFGNMWVHILFQRIAQDKPHLYRKQKQEWRTAFFVATLGLIAFFIVTIYALYSTSGTPMGT